MTTRKPPALPPNLERAAQAAIALDLGPPAHVEDAALAALFEVTARNSQYLRQSPEGWLCVLRLHLPMKPRFQLLLVPPLLATGDETPQATRRRRRRAPKLKLLRGGRSAWAWGASP
jgi:hypothetical protein